MNRCVWRCFYTTGQRCIRAETRNYKAHHWTEMYQSWDPKLQAQHSTHLLQQPVKLGLCSWTWHIESAKSKSGIIFNQDDCCLENCCTYCVSFFPFHPITVKIACLGTIGYSVCMINACKKNCKNFWMPLLRFSNLLCNHQARKKGREKERNDCHQGMLL